MIDYLASDRVLLVVRNLRWCQHPSLGRVIIEFPFPDLRYASAEECIFRLGLDLSPSELRRLLDARPTSYLEIACPSDPDHEPLVRLLLEEGSSVGHVDVRAGRYDGRLENYTCQIPQGSTAAMVMSGLLLREEATKRCLDVETERLQDLTYAEWTGALEDESEV
jgi:hypothetical protein